MNNTLWKQLDSLPKGKVAILSDFDGTITSTETLGFIFRKYAEAKLEYAKRWTRGEIDMREEFQATFETVKATKEEMEQGLSQIEIAPGFLEFLEYVRRKGFTFGIVSDGLEWYIRYILNRYHISDIPIYANRIFFEPAGYRFEFPWFHEETKRRGVCKSKIVRMYQNNFNTVVFIGDGRSDIDAVHEADIVFSKGWLAGYCFAKGMGEGEFYEWVDVKTKLEKQLDD
jgi:2,3-diketo-5-methylthio-1-phosphopentane phosphatase